MSDINTALINGTAIAETIRGEIKTEVDALREKTGKVPGLGVVLVGERPDSAVYVRMKHKACSEAGIHTSDRKLPADATEEDVLAVVKELNEDPAINGILVQLPMPDHINEERVLSAVGVDKDVDGFHPVNIGRICMKGRKANFEPCTPKGCIELLVRSGITIEGKRAVVLGRSNIVGIPVANMLIHRNATVTVVHSRTQDIPSVVREADIVIAAIGQPLFVKREWLKPGVVIIDVGINSIEDASRKSGKRLVGDVDTEGAQGVASHITPVPGGVGPMTIAMLLSNTLAGFKASIGV
mmetsp:Transcript_18268/g.42922  ORF Transcript_18268/g.42922 Transcript_18268/m.42922 type:complete len:297 (-) Transcript_18268:23-913(-)